MAPPRSTFGASPSRGRHPWPGKAGSTVAHAWNPLAFARERWRAWWLARQPRRDTVELTQRNVYILPTRAGLMLAVTLLVLLIASINFQLGLGYLLTFALAGSVLASMHACHATLRGLALHLAPPPPHFCDEPARLDIVLTNRRRAPRHGLCLRAQGQADGVWCDVPAQGNATVQLTLRFARRGWHALPTLALDTRFPLGAFRAWTVWQPAARVLSYPAPARNAPPLPPTQADASGVAASLRRFAGDEWDGARAYRRGDPLKQVLWKKAARSGELVSRDTQQAHPARLWLDLSACGGGTLEQRLSRLCAWVLEAERLGLDYGLRLPALEIAPAQGDVHQRRCLEALALC